jgi:hypothetical protein
MIRFRYGPWDKRYRRWIGLLMSKGLADTFVSGRTVHVRITDKGRAVAESLAARPEFADFDARSNQISQAVGSTPGTRLKDLIYEVVPELTGMNWGEEIAP